MMIRTKHHDGTSATITIAPCKSWDKRKVTCTHYDAEGYLAKGGSWEDFLLADDLQAQIDCMHARGDNFTIYGDNGKVIDPRTVVI